MTGKQLKNSILQWAIQGKLVPQDPNDEPASVLLEKIRAEKARLIKEGKIKKDKKESIIYRGDDNSYYEKILATGEVKCIDDELPFMIPKSWEWVRLRSITSILGDGIHGTPEYDERGSYYFINGNNLKEKTIIIKPDTKNVNEKEYLKYKKNLDENTILVSINGTLGNVAYYNNEPVMLGKSACYFNLMSHDLKDYIYIVLNSPFFLEYALSAATGTTIKNVSLQAMNNLLIPFPSLPEQNRILNKIEMLKSSLDKYSKQEVQLTKLNNSIRQTLKKSVLQEAIQGKLVPQDASEEPASVLLQRIKDEKQRLVKEGKLKKKDVVDSVIYKGDDNKYYEQLDGTTLQIEPEYTFPETWEIVRLAHICRLMDGEKKEGNHVCLDAKYLRGKSSGDILPKGKFVSTGDNIILVDGENSGEIFAVPHDGYMGSTFKQLWVSSNMHLPYVLYFIQFYKDLLRNSKKGSAIPHLNKEIFYSLVVGIPPYHEQERIAKRIEEISNKIKG